MKKKYSTLLNFALTAGLAITLAGCSGDSSVSEVSQGTNQNSPRITIGGVVVDTNGNALENVGVSCQGSTPVYTNSLGTWSIPNLLVTNVAGPEDDTNQESIAVRCVIEKTDGYLGAIVSVRPEAQMDAMEDVDESDISSYFVTFIDGMYAEAGTAWLPKMSSTVKGRLEHCDTEESIVGAVINLDMLAVDNNQLESQAGSACDYGCSVDYSTPGYTAVTGADGKFTIANVPDDSVLKFLVEEYRDIDVDDEFQVTNSVLYYPESTDKDDGMGTREYITTINEGVLQLGDVCVRPISMGDSTRPCVADIEGWTNRDGTSQVFEAWHGDDKIRFAQLHDDLDGTTGIDIVFNEAMDADEIDENSIVVFDATADDYITGFGQSISGRTLTITTTDPIPDDHQIVVYLLVSDFRDVSGNFLTSPDYPSSTSACPDVFFTEDFVSNNSMPYVVVGFKIHSPDSTDVGAATDLAQVCLDEGGDAGMADLNAIYPNVFTDQGSSSTVGNFDNLNSDPDYEFRLEAMADVIGGGSQIANVRGGYATVTFTEADDGSYEVDANSSTFCSGSNDGSSNSCTVSGVSVGNTVYITSYDDFDNPGDVASIVLQDCVAPTTVLNFAYNTCGHIGYGDNLDFASPDVANTGWDMDYAGHVCATGDIADILPFGDGGENSDPGEQGSLGNPTLNITCRLLKDPTGLPGDIANTGGPPPNPGNTNLGIDFYRLYDGDNGLANSTGWVFEADDRLYDATEFAAWGAFPDTIGVAFSEDIAKVDSAMPTLSGTAGTASVDSWSVVNDVSVQDDGWPTDNNPYIGSFTGPVNADLAMVSFSDVIALANDYHGELLDFDGAVVDSKGIASENADVTINDLMAPFVERAYWDGDLVIEFNEDVDVSSYGVDECYVTLEGGLGNDVDVDVTDAVVVGNTMTWTTVPLDRTDIFHEGDWDEPLYNDVAPVADSDLAHGSLNTDCVTDTRGNSWDDWQADGNGIFLDPVGQQQCRTPEFLAVDLLGDFTDTKTAPEFACGGNNDVVISTTTSHPVDYTATYGCDVDTLSTAELVNCMAPFIEFNGDAVDGTTSTDLELIDVTVALSRTSATFTLDNIGGPVIFGDGDQIIFYGLVGSGNGVYVSVYEITPNLLPSFNLVCGGP